MTNIQRGQLPTIILSALLDSDKYGLEIITKIKEQTNGAVEIKQPTLYSTLTRLEKQKFINSYWREGDFGGKRHYYSITDLGKKHLESLNEVFISDFSSENKKNRMGNASSSKYDDLTHFEKKDEEPVENNDNKIQNIDSELENLNLSSGSFFQNLKTTQDASPKIENIFQTQNFDTAPEVKIQEISQKTLESEIQVGEVLETETFEENFEQEFEESSPQKFEVENKTIDGGIFIQEKIEASQIPAVKKMDSVKFEKLESNITPPIVSKIKPPENMAYQEKINDLYEKTKQNIEKDGEPMSVISLEDLQKYYNAKNIKFYIKKSNSVKHNSHKKTVSTKSILVKYITIFGIVLLETLAMILASYFMANEVKYPYIYCILPILALIPVVYYLFKNQHNLYVDFDGKSFVISLLIFVVSIGLLYAVNLLLGITFSTIFEHLTTLVYPAILATNILISAVWDSVIIRKN